jgi:hypothetical protein
VLDEFAEIQEHHIAEKKNQIIIDILGSLFYSIILSKEGIVSKGLKIAFVVASFNLPRAAAPGRFSGTRNLCGILSPLM